MLGPTPVAVKFGNISNKRWFGYSIDGPTELSHPTREAVRQSKGFVLLPLHYHTIYNLRSYHFMTDEWLQLCQPSTPITDIVAH